MVRQFYKEIHLISFKNMNLKDCLIIIVKLNQVKQWNLLIKISYNQEDYIIKNHHKNLLDKI